MKWLVRFSENHFKYEGRVEIEANSLTWDWSNENRREEFLDWEEPIVGDTVFADHVKITFDEPILKPHLLDSQHNSAKDD